MCWSCCCECTVGPTEEILSPAAVTQQEKSARRKKYQKPSGRSDVSERAEFKATAADLTEASQISADITGSKMNMSVAQPFDLHHSNLLFMSPSC